ncbi:MAG TPA: PDR/VanB family oxidoreductase [Pseudonocardia sp.]|jgi:ferredoxin-NADP reductase|nr:PDR/VanB family oxidoreductase [Pseudonocardia sp.]
MTELLLTVRARHPVAEGALALELGDPTGAALPEWTPGAHLDLVLAPDLVRQYSLCGDPADRTRWRIAVLREPAGRGGSARLHDTLRTGDTVRVRGPRNRFPLEPSPRYLFVAGGIGITPLLPMLASAEAAGADWRLVYGGRTAASMAFAAELRAAHGDRVSLHPQDEHGPLDLDRLLGTSPENGPPADTLVYCCGPGGLLDEVHRRTAHWPAGVLHVERFTPEPPGAPPADQTSDQAFEVELALSGLTLRVPPDRSVLDVLEQHGVPVLSSCRAGTCGTCETTVLAGRVEHRDSLLTEPERAAHDTMFPCVSRAAGPTLLLEL